MERLTLGVTFLFVAMIGLAVWYAQPELVSGSYKRVIGAITGTNMGGAQVDNRDVDCERDEYAGSKICQDRGRSQSNWSGIVLNAGGKEKPFSLHERSPQPSSSNSKH